MNYHEDHHKYTIDLLMFRKFLYALPEVMNEEVWNYHALNKHCESIEETIEGGMDIWYDPGQDVSDLCHDLKSYMVTIKHNTQSTKVRVQGIAI